MRQRSASGASKSSQLVLASASPRRREILQAAGIAFRVHPTSVIERQKRGETPREFVRRMAIEKAEAARAALQERATLSIPGAILGADTIVVVGARTLGKPRSPADARRMLRLLSGREHRVLTGLCLLYVNGSQSGSPKKAASAEQWKRRVRVATTTVRFRRLSPAEIAEYVATGEPFDKAGAYAIQGRACKYVQQIRGCYFNVVGMPISLLYEMLCEMLKGMKGRSCLAANFHGVD